MRIATRLMVLVAFLGALAGCTEPPVTFRAYVDPPTGHVPYAARVLFSGPPGTVTVELPDGSSITTREDEVDVTVDRLEWTARATWTDGDRVSVDHAQARGTNALPLILAPRLNGDAYLWKLEPYVKTLIDFTHYANSLSGPESGVVYDGAWRVASIRVEAEVKELCGSPIPDSIYTPPWEDGAYHAIFRDLRVENACIVYPLLTMETAPNGRPYAPDPLDGYICDRVTNRDPLDAVAYPAQTAHIVVTVEDDWGRRTSASFEVPVSAIALQSFYDEFEDDVFFVSSQADPYYYRRRCSEVCRIPAQDRLYFASEENAEAAGKHRSPSCFED